METNSFNQEDNKGWHTYIWLLIAGLFTAFAMGRWIIPVCTWIAPVFMLRYLRNNRPFKGIATGFLLYIIALSIAYWGILRTPSIIFFLMMVVLINIITFIPYIIDRLLYGRLKGFISTLLFPLLYIAMEYGVSFNPNTGSFSSLAYTQVWNKPFIQIASITGIYGISFLITWFASIVNWIWEKEFSFTAIRKGIAIYVGIMTAVLLYGGCRFLHTVSYEKGIHIAGITPQYPKTNPFFEWLKSGNCPPVSSSIQELEAMTGKAVLTGAEMVVWNECSAFISKQDKDTYVKAGQRLAKEYNIFLMLSFDVLGDSKEDRDNKNLAIFIDQKGDILWEYVKNHLVPGLEKSIIKVTGDKEIPVRRTPYGVIAGIICFDMDFPFFINKAGRAGVDIMLDPSHDWREISPYHTYMASYRAIENGFSVVKVTSDGFSAFFDNRGRIIASMDYFSTKNFILSAEVPVERSATLYSIIGDSFAWAGLASLLILFAAALRKKRKT